MKLQALQLNYFKRHIDLAINFSDTLTVIRGPNWAGKSTILHAIFFALFGAAAVPCAKERIPTRGQKNTKVTLWFEWNGVDCVIERTLTTCSLYVNNALKATSASAVSQFVQDEILGLSLKDALTLAYSPQSQTAALLTLGVPALNRMIESLTQADMIETLVARAGKVIQNTEAKLGALGEHDVTEPKEQVAAWSSAYSLAHGNLQVATQSQLFARNEVLKLEAAHTEISKQNELLMFAENDRQQLERVLTTIREVDADLAALGSDNLTELTAELAKLNSQYVEPYEQKLEIERSQAELKRLEQWFDTVGADWEVKEANIPLLAKEKEVLDRLSEALLTANTAYSKAQSEYIAKQAALEHGVCSACERPFENFDPVAAKKALDEALKNAGLAKQALDLARKAVADSKAEVARLEKLQPPHDYEQQHAAKVEQYELLQKSLEAKPHPADLAKTLVEIQTGIDGVRARIAQAQASQRQRQQLKVRRETAAMQAQTLEKSLANAPKGERQDLAPMTAQLGEARKRMHDASELLSLRQRTAMEAQSEFRAWEERLKIAESSQQLRAALESKAERFNALLKWLRQSKSAFLGRIWDQLTLVASEIVTGATSGYASSLYRTDDGEFVVVEDGEEVPMISASGGMASICGVALRMALDHVLAQSVGFVVLDEPSSELNDEHAASLAGALRAQQRQVILVTHREGEEFVSDTVISL